MRSILGRLLRGALELALGIPLALLLLWQAVFIGLRYNLTIFLWVCIGGVVAYIGLMAIHELGHLLAGKAMGLPFWQFTFGPLIIVNEGERLRARLNTAWFQHAVNVRFWLTGVTGWPFRMAVMTLGGPLANLLIGVACLAVASWLNPGPPAEMPASAREGLRSVALLYPGDLATAVLNLVGLLSLGLGLGSLIPGRAAGLRTDGGQLLDLWRGSFVPVLPPQLTIATFAPDPLIRNDKGDTQDFRA